VLTEFRFGSLKGRDCLEDLGLDGRIILKQILGKEGVDWIHLSQDRDRWQTLVYTLMNLRVP
jgi:hypothetical protein